MRKKLVDIQNSATQKVVSCAQEEYDDDDEWNPCKAAGVCLMLMATCCEDDVVPHVLPFVKDNISNTDWRYRDAAVMAFGTSKRFVYISTTCVSTVLCCLLRSINIVHV